MKVDVLGRDGILGKQANNTKFCIKKPVNAYNTFTGYYYRPYIQMLFIILEMFGL